MEAQDTQAAFFKRVVENEEYLDQLLPPICVLCKPSHPLPPLINLDAQDMEGGNASG